MLEIILLYTAKKAYTLHQIFLDYKVLLKILLSENLINSIKIFIKHKNMH